MANTSSETQAKQSWKAFAQEGIAALRLNESDNILHRFSTDIAPGDVVPDSNKSYIKRPEIFNLPDGSKKVTGVSFFTPIDKLSEAAHAFFKLKANF
jgi:hypothetical protein